MIQFGCDNPTGRPGSTVGAVALEQANAFARPPPGHYAGAPGHIQELRRKPWTRSFRSRCHRPGASLLLATAVTSQTEGSFHAEPRIPRSATLRGR